MIKPDGWAQAFDTPFFGDNWVVIETAHGSISNDVLEKFTRKAEGSFVCDEIPYDEVSFSVVGWSGLNVNIRNDLSGKNNYIDVHYVVAGYYNMAYRRYYISDFAVDYKNYRATIKAKSVFSIMKDKLVYDMSVLADDYIKKVAQQIATQYGYSLYFPISRDYAFEYLPYSITNAEMLQHIAVCAGCGLDLRTQGSINVSLLSASKNVNHTLNMINIRTDLDIYHDTQYNVIVCGYDKSPAEEVVG